MPDPFHDTSELALELRALFGSIFMEMPFYNLPGPLYTEKLQAVSTDRDGKTYIIFETAPTAVPFGSLTAEYYGSAISTKITLSRYLSIESKGSAQEHAPIFLGVYGFFFQIPNRSLTQPGL
ncbi:hypothetical protein TWF569_009248 [Orbilia oligospora]|uniref:Uncharacterized protein n=1 Tax=Orbilia oligospora TaxID=2813651 RepID=A0A7C8JFS5_ORBOL|nr:hypothetical protein TWF706_006617 [Orbilia oligospora]KAF3104822.1 hypothetical protein TWF103_006796 [Orbilia oligospora]KAF3109257.1 hypothetical protein TWF102_010030 [Orbilia oligospora]KAF3135103.1 hypothetical protein TWF594_008493 [Orbilia oligospora]KAF3137314.1 hypothetical protein TWF569_009248 [Orbilia oligospora]